MLKFVKPLMVVSSVMVLLSPNFAQEASIAQKGAYASTEGYATLHADCPLGSMKVIDGEGKMTFSAKGTVLFNGLTGEKRLLSGKWKMEYDGRGRQCYTVDGTIEVTGKWRGLQWLGSDMKMVWWGRGITRISGEFVEDPNTGDLITGRYWYNDPAEWQAFPSSNVVNVLLPQQVVGADTSLTPKVRGGSTGGG